jgi:non-homologous end joining protein Ku
MQPLKTATSTGVAMSLGMLNLLVSVHAAVGEDDGAGLRTVCVNDHAPTPIRQKYVCPVCESDDRASFAKARQVGDGYVVIPEEVIETEKLERKSFSKNMTLTVHPAVEVTSMLMPSGKCYYLALKNPTQNALDTYTLVSQLITSRPDLAFMTKFTLRTATSVFRLSVAGAGTLLLTQMAEAELVREHPPITFSDINPRMLELASVLADQQMVPFLATHGSGKSHIIAAYAESQTPIAPAASTTEEAPAATGNVLDLLTRLEATVGASAAKATPKKTAATKTAATKKTTTRRTTTQKVS